MTNLYAIDGKCHNANRGTYGHECGKPAVWLGTKRSGFTSGYCQRCKDTGDEAALCIAWVRVPGQQAYEADVAAQPVYHDGTPRKTWDRLSPVARWSWERP